MNSRGRKLLHGAITIIGLTLLSFVSNASAQQAQSQEMTTTTNDQETTKLPPEELDSLVAPIALYPDDLLAQTLAASTYPLEIVQLQQWMNNNTNLKDKALADAASKQPWDPSVQGLVMYPDVVQRMAGNIQWTTDVGNAFLAQQSDVMAAVQGMRGKAESKGTLKTSAQQTVQTTTAPSGEQVITIQSAQPDVVYVPSYDPQVVYGAPPPAYPYYPYTYPGYVPGTALMWGAGIAIGAAAWGAWGGHWGSCDWNGGNVKINNNYNYNKNNNFNRNVNRQGNGNWQHNPQHRGNAPYGDRGTANKFGGNARQQPGRGAGGAGRAGAPGGAGGAGTRPGGGGAGTRPGGVAGAKPGGGAGARPGGGGGARPGGGTGKSQVGNHSASSRPSSGATKGGGFGGGGSGNYARASSKRGGESMGGAGMSPGGGASMSGGGRGGGGGHSGMSRGGGHSGARKSRGGGGHSGA